ncbi:hypothetical protein TNCV_4091091 [Trichonephila clavipes]|nr:hypothetical protein TNCV_4091091 [Trichonephila clavipes]
MHQRSSVGDGRFLPTSSDVTNQWPGLVSRRCGQDTIAVFIFALFTGNGFLRNFGVPKGQRTLRRVNLYPCTACWPIGMVKFTARTLKRMIFRVGAVDLYKGLAREFSGFFYSLFTSARKNPPVGSALATRGHPFVALSLSFQISKHPCNI